MASSQGHLASIDSLMNQMTLVEKIGQLNLVNPGDQPLTGAVANQNVRRQVLDGQVGMMFGTASIESRIEIQRMCVGETRLKIPMIFASDVIHGYRTALPLPIALACSWDLELVQRAAHLSATEARADGIDLTFAPMVDVTRDPRWGRVAEGAGESPVLGAMIAAATVRGFQGPPDSGQLHQPDRVAACVKHFVGYGAADGGREYAAVNVGPNELHATHLPPFQAAVDAQVAALMPGFHTVDRLPVTGDQRLINDLLRQQWRFDGLIISDYTAINELQAHGLGDLPTVASIAINAGVDVDMVGESYVSTLEQSVESGRVSVATIDAACRRVLRLKQKLGLFDDPFRSLDPDRSTSVVGCDLHREEAALMAARSCVLLKNDSSVLPIDSPAKVALIGPLVDDQANLAGTWSVSARPEDSVSLLDGFRALADPGITIATARGCNLVSDPVMAQRLNVFGETVTMDQRTKTEMIDEAVKVARSSDVAVITVGEAKEHSGECSSRTQLTIDQDQMDLVRSVHATGCRVVLVVFAGRPLVLTEQIDFADAILYVWYGGSLTGPGISKVLLGKVAPSGRLAMSLPRSVGQIPVHHDQLPTGRPLGPEVTYEKFKSCYLDDRNVPLFPFGYGLTYTTFVIDTLAIDRDTIDGDQIATVTASVRNAGHQPGVAVVQMYLSDTTASVSRPMREFKNFQRVEIAPGEDRKISFSVSVDDFAFVTASHVADFTRAFSRGEKRIEVGLDAEHLHGVSITVV